MVYRLIFTFIRLHPYCGATQLCCNCETTCSEELFTMWLYEQSGAQLLIDTTLCNFSQDLCKACLMLDGLNSGKPREALRGPSRVLIV